MAAVAQYAVPALGEGDWFSEHANNVSFCDLVGRVQREWTLLQHAVSGEMQRESNARKKKKKKN